LLDAPPAFESPPRGEFLTRAKGNKVLAKNSQWRARLNGDLRMHTEWSDGGGTISEMAAAAIEHGYKFIAITDHTKGLKIAGGLEIYVR
jgi:PHP domain